MSSNERTALIGACRHRALQKLTLAHPEEFKALVNIEYDAAGLEVRTRVTGKAAKIARLQAQLAALEADTSDE